VRNQKLTLDDIRTKDNFLKEKISENQVFKMDLL
jgi:hypothetical protein